MSDNNGWIRCIDRMPPVAGRYLVYDGKHVREAYCERYTTGAVLFETEEACIDATHWMPLPAPPALPQEPAS